jgi:hypothetical protein
MGYVRRVVGVDLRELRGAVARREAAAIVAAVEGRDVEDVLQLLGSGLLAVLADDRDLVEGLTVRVIEALRERDAEGDDVLADQLVAAVDGTPRAMTTLPVDLEELATHLEGSYDQPGPYLDRRTGEVLPGVLTDPMWVGADEAVEIDDDPERWLYLGRSGSREGWEDMASFAARVVDDRVRQRLDDAIHGKGAFRRFKNVVSDEGLWDEWQPYSDDRAMGRARELLFAQDILAVPPR